MNPIAIKSRSVVIKSVKCQDPSAVKIYDRDHFPKNWSYDDFTDFDFVAETMRL